MTSSPCFFVTCKDFWYLAAVTMSVEKSTDHMPYSVKNISHNKGILLLMLITKFSKPRHVAIVNIFLWSSHFLLPILSEGPSASPHSGLNGYGHCIALSKAPLRGDHA